MLPLLARLEKQTAHNDEDYQDDPSESGYPTSLHGRLPFNGVIREMAPLTSHDVEANVQDAEAGEGGMIVILDAARNLAGPL